MTSMGDVWLATQIPPFLGLFSLQESGQVNYLGLYLKKEKTFKTVHSTVQTISILPVNLNTFSSSHTLMDKATHGEYVKSLNSPQYVQGLEILCQHSKYRITHGNRAHVYFKPSRKLQLTTETAFSLHFSPVYNFHFYLFCKIVHIKKKSILLTFASHPLRVKGHPFHKGSVNVACFKILIIIQSIIVQRNLSATLRREGKTCRATYKCLVYSVDSWLSILLISLVKALLTLALFCVLHSNVRMSDVSWHFQLLYR